LPSCRTIKMDCFFLSVLSVVVFTVSVFVVSVFTVSIKVMGWSALAGFSTFSALTELSISCGTKEGCFAFDIVKADRQVTMAGIRSKYLMIWKRGVCFLFIMLIRFLISVILK